MTLPRGLRAVRGVGGALAFAAPEVEAWVRGALGRGEGLYEAATRDAATRERMPQTAFVFGGNWGEQAAQ